MLQGNCRRLNKLGILSIPCADMGGFTSQRITMFCGAFLGAPAYGRKLSNTVTCTPESLFEFLSSVGPDRSWGMFVADRLGGVCVYFNLDCIIV